MRAARLSLSATLLAACSFTAPGPVAIEDAQPGDTGDVPPDSMPGCADDDHDTICNDADKCAGFDDRLDADADMVADGCDDWPCGAKPGDPGNDMSVIDLGSQRYWAANNMVIGTGHRLVVTAGAQYNAKFHWAIAVTCQSGQSCQAQAEYGYGQDRVGCLFDGNVQSQQPRGGDIDMPFTAPMATAPTRFDLRLNTGRRPSCGTGQPWFFAAPGGNSTIAILCVKPTT